MNISRAEQQLDKIQALLGQIKKGNPSALDRDVLLGYVRELYDSLLESAAPKVVAPPVQPPVAAPPRVEPKPEEKAKPVITTFDNTPPPPPAPVKSPEPPRPVVPPAQPTAPPVKVAPPTPPTPPAPPVTPPPAPKPVEAPAPPPAPNPQFQSNLSSFGDDELDELFKILPPTDMATRLSMQNIPVLGKNNFSLNDRMHIETNLFGGDIALFENTLEQINQAGSYQVACDYLTKHIVMPKGWLNSSESKKLAKVFVKMVWRRWN